MVAWSGFRCASASFEYDSTSLRVLGICAYASRDFEAHGSEKPKHGGVSEQPGQANAYQRSLVSAISVACSRHLRMVIRKIVFFYSIAFSKIVDSAPRALIAKKAFFQRALIRVYLFEFQNRHLVPRLGEDRLRPFRHPRIDIVVSILINCCNDSKFNINLHHTNKETNRFDEI